FADSIGRTDFPTSDHQTLLASIQRQLYTLPDATVVLPGHGPATTVGQEKKTNPYVRPL
ncbi:MAG: MBL fold metallo-hydrolase, partial [Phycisphaeraceae bacterium]|nr:MBL fold metallo-hydrolase [Phycisphaeraceae bacterium]